jgi:hypothetical protein
MASSFAWLDFSDRDRQRAMDVVDLFREEDTRDELGIGVIRDAFADRLFPGTSTVQTRVRYFLFLPWLFEKFRARDTTEERFAKRRRLLQDRLRKSLIEGGEELGVIGYQAGAAVQRLPSSVYWNGLRRWDILRFRGSESDYRRELARLRLVGERPTNDDGEPFGGDHGELWDPSMPSAPDGWLDATTFALQAREAEYLRFRLEVAAKDSVLTHFVNVGVEPGESAFAWDHLPVESLPIALREELQHARNFSESMHGASLLYNLMLSEETEREDWVEGYRNSIAEWWNMRTARAGELASWDRQRFWSLLTMWNARVRPPAQAFVESWLSQVDQMERPEDVLESAKMRSLIESRERALKGPRARLGNPRARNLWRGSSGSAQLDYRWKDPVRSMVTDIVRGLRSED